MKNKISIIIPAYNCEKFIERCLNSLINQEYINYEVIIINDGSLDNTENVCNEFIYKNKLSNFKVISQKNGGVSKARNTGILESTGEYVVFIDADDYVSNDFLKIISSSIGNYDFLVHNFYEDKGDFLISNKNYSILKENDIEKLIINILSPKNANKICGVRIDSIRNVWAKVYKRNIIMNNNIKFNEKLKYFEDGLFNLEYLKYCTNIKMINNTLYYYYTESADSATNKKHNNLFIENEEKVIIVEKIISSYNNKKIFESFNIFKFDLFVSYLKNDLFHKNNKISFYNKYKEFKKNFSKEIQKKYLQNVNIKYLKFTKKIIYLLLKFNLVFLVSFILNK